MEIIMYLLFYSFLFFVHDMATTEIYTLSLHDALPIFGVVDHLSQGIDDSCLLGIGYGHRHRFRAQGLSGLKHLYPRLALIAAIQQQKFGVFDFNTRISHPSEGFIQHWRTRLQIKRRFVSGDRRDTETYEIKTGLCCQLDKLWWFGGQ